MIMSFSSEVKAELAANISTSRHCQLAELAAFFCFLGRVEESENGGLRLGLQTENAAVQRKCFTLLKKTFNIDRNTWQLYDEEEKGHTYVILTENSSEVNKILQAVKMDEKDGLKKIGENGVNSLLIKNACCKRAFLRGAFLCIGSMSDPGKSYHLEFVCTHKESAEQLKELIQGFEVDAKIVIRKKYYVVYLKEGAGIVDLLNIMEAHKALMNFENYRIVKEVRNSINRKVNCETANINKTVSAAVRQMEDIKYIRDTIGFDRLPEGLKDVALTRLENPDATLKELGGLLKEPVGKSGVNHRLRKLSEIAVKLRD